eukprot:2323491-Pleurochrysis_carterae.AAC.1
MFHVRHPYVISWRLDRMRTQRHSTTQCVPTGRHDIAVVAAARAGQRPSLRWCEERRSRLGRARHGRPP